MTLGTYTAFSQVLNSAEIDGSICLSSWRSLLLPSEEKEKYIHLFYSGSCLVYSRRLGSFTHQHFINIMLLFFNTVKFR